MTQEAQFKLKDEFIKNYKKKKTPMDVVGYITYKRTYSRPKGNKSETWTDTVQRVVEGTFTFQKQHCVNNKLYWNERKAQNSAEKMFDLMWNFKFTPPGRGLWMMGSDYVFKRGGAALNNCAFTSTEELTIDFAEPFTFLMDMSMVGVGVGFDTKGAGKITIKNPKTTEEPHVIPDTREGWVELLRLLLNAYAGKNELPTTIDYSQIRQKGEPIKGFGGVSSGYEPLKLMYDDIKKILDARIGEKITSSDIVDIMNIIGRCVVSGNVRRSAEIAFGDPNDEEFLNLKNPETNKDALMSHRWASNNSIFAKVGMDYSQVAELTAKNGEPGYEWLENAQKYSRMGNGHEPDWKDYRAAGGNPCLEQTLEPYELCCLVETYPSNHDTMEEWIETLKYAYLYAKTVTLVPTHNPKTNMVMNRNRRIGCSVSGLTQAFTKFGRRHTLEKLSEGYDSIQEWDKTYSEWFGIPRSIKMTSVKPSGTVSLLAGVTPGVHYPIAQYYIRRIRISKISPLIPQLKEAGYYMEEDKYSNDAMVVDFPAETKHYDRSLNDVTIWEQLENVAQVQQYWADNQVSVTVSFKPEEAKDIKNALELYEIRLKGVSFLPLTDHGYEQAPYETITKERYDEMIANIKNINIKDDVHEVDEKFCDTDVCEIKISTE